MRELFDITINDVEIIKELWEKNRLYHQNSSEFFGEVYKDLHFGDRMKAFKSIDSKNLKITVAKEDNKYIGYCISTVQELCGEIQSVHVDQMYRGNGVGKQLVKNHINWLKDRECNTIGVTVSQENENTIAFYRELGFFPNTLYMQQK